MKIKKLIPFAVFMFLPLVITLIALPFMPEEIPAHYGVGLSVDRWGSKFEALVLPIITVVFGLVIFGCTKLAALGSEEGSNRNNEKVGIMVGLVFLILFNILNLYFLYLFIHKITNLADMSIDLMSLMVVLFGAAFVVVGNIMPKTKMNSLIGFRTPWTMKNEVTWKKCQLFGGITMMIAGAVLIVGGCLIFRGNQAIIFMLSVLIVLVITDVVYSYFVMKKYENCSCDIHSEKEG